jgi:hypothetical protein
MRTTSEKQRPKDLEPGPGFAPRCWQGGVAIIALLAVGCAAAKPPAVVAPAPPPPPPPAAEPPPRPDPVKLVWMPLDPMVHAKLGVALNGRFEHAQVPGVDVQTKSPVSMDVAQMSLECGQATVECFVAVGRHLQANRLLWADVKRDKHKKIIVALSLLDVGRGAMVRRAEHTFANPRAALAGVDGLMTELTSPSVADDKTPTPSRTKP